MDTAPPFAARPHDLGGVRLEPAGPHATALGALMIGIYPWSRSWTNPADMAARFTRPDASAHRFAILRQGTLAGAVIVRYPFMRGPYLEMLGLSEPARGSGAGRAILDWMAREVAGEARNLWLCVSDHNQPARAFYAHMGFDPVGPLPDLAVEGSTEIFMRKRI